MGKKLWTQEDVRAAVEKELLPDVIATVDEDECGDVYIYNMCFTGDEVTLALKFAKKHSLIVDITASGNEVWIGFTCDTENAETGEAGV